MKSSPAHGNPPTEADILRQCFQYLQTVRRYMVWRSSTGAARYTNRDGTTRLMRFGPLGQPDILGVIPHLGRLLAVEIKRPGRSPTRAQADFLDRVNRSGGLAFCVHSLQELIEGLQRELEI